MSTTRTYGQPPHQLAVIHGGPGAAGEMAPVARRLSRQWGVLEPLQSARCVNGQVSELIHQLKDTACLPATLIGFSWGAWLSLLVAARHPQTIARLILIGCPPVVADQAHSILQARLNRLDGGGQREASMLLARIERQDGRMGSRDLQRLADLFRRADAHGPLVSDAAPIQFSASIFQRVWPEAAELRASGRLMDRIRRVRCPVVAIHGDTDPHPVAGMAGSLASALPGFRLIVLEACGHRPWIERSACGPFYDNLRDSIEARPMA